MYMWKKMLSYIEICRNITYNIKQVSISSSDDDIQSLVTWSNMCLFFFSFFFLSLSFFLFLDI